MTQDSNEGVTGTLEHLARLRDFGPSALGDRLGIELVSAAPELVVGRMPVAGNTQPFGLLHGGASAALAEHVGSIAANLHAGPGRHALGIELSISHHRSLSEGSVLATAEAVHLGRTAATYEISIEDEAGRRVASARLTCLLRPDR